ncbi:MAG TPA: methyltransferase [Cyclobacteriaceae bacterium]|nr:methyltransferase [Cyclobacteriaceae bacterium]
MKNLPPFQFKKFIIHHDRCSMKVGTDAVLLGSWTDVNVANQILDVGTGSGVIALMFAQRTNDKVHIDAIEIEKQDAAQAKENVSLSPWSTKVTVSETSFQNFQSTTKYDLVVSNPPYFINSLLPPAPHRQRTRHTEQLTFEELITHSIRLLNSTGTLAVILPVQEGNDFKQLALKNGLHLKRQLAFYSRKEKPQERWLFEFGFELVKPKEEKLILYETGNIKSNDYINLTKDFYL